MSIVYLFNEWEILLGIPILCKGMRKEAVSHIWDISIIWCNIFKVLCPQVSHWLRHSQWMHLHLGLLSFKISIIYLTCLASAGYWIFPPLAHRYFSFWSSLKWSPLCWRTHSKNTQNSSPNSVFFSASRPLYTFFFFFFSLFLAYAMLTLSSRLSSSDEASMMPSLDMSVTLLWVSVAFCVAFNDNANMYHIALSVWLGSCLPIRLRANS